VGSVGASTLEPCRWALGSDSATGHQEFPWEAKCVYLAESHLTKIDICIFDLYALHSTQSTTSLVTLLPQSPNIELR